MALKNLFGKTMKAASTACGSACGAGDKKEERPAACGSACGAGEKILRFNGISRKRVTSAVSIAISMPLEVMPSLRRWPFRIW